MGANRKVGKQRSLVLVAIQLLLPTFAWTQAGRPPGDPIAFELERIFVRPMGGRTPSDKAAGRVKFLANKTWQAEGNLPGLGPATVTRSCDWLFNKRLLECRETVRTSDSETEVLRFYGHDSAVKDLGAWTLTSDGMREMLSRHETRTGKTVLMQGLDHARQPLRFILREGKRSFEETIEVRKSGEWASHRVMRFEEAQRGPAIGQELVSKPSPQLHPSLQPLQVLVGRWEATMVRQPSSIILFGTERMKADFQWDVEGRMLRGEMLFTCPVTFGCDAGPRLFFFGWNPAKNSVMRYNVGESGFGQSAITVSQDGNRVIIEWEIALRSGMPQLRRTSTYLPRGDGTLLVTEKWDGLDCTKVTVSMCEEKVSIWRPRK